MKTSSKISVTIFVLVLLGLVTYGFIVFRDRNSAPKINKDPGSTQSQDNQTAATSSNDAAVDNSSVDSTDDSNVVANENAPDESNNFLDISKTDCTNQCKDFTDPNDLKYCQEVCGLSGIKKDVQEKKGCDALKDLEKDYCLKDLAINNKDIAICAEISDTDIKKVCKNRIAQDLLESQK